MSKIYKYASIDSDLLILKNQNIVVSDPTTFNNPFDSEMLDKSSNIKNGLKTYVDFMFENEMVNCCQKFIDSGTIKQKGICQRFINRINRRRAKGRKRSSYYPHITLDYIKFMAKVFGFTIPEDKRLIAMESFASIEQMNGDEGAVKLESIIGGNIPRSLRVSFFSKRPDISKMWSH